MSVLIDEMDYPTFELGIYVGESRADDADGITRRQTGDIAVARPANIGVGLKEMHSFLWLRVEGWSRARMMALTAELTPYSQPDVLDDPIDNDEEAMYEKNRFCVPMKALKAVMPSFDVDRAMDELDRYQPFLIVDEGNGDDARIEEGLFLMDSRPIDLDGIIFDKLLQRYISGD